MSYFPVTDVIMSGLVYCNASMLLFVMKQDGGSGQDKHWPTMRAPLLLLQKQQLRDYTTRMRTHTQAGPSSSGRNQLLHCNSETT